MRIVSEKVGRTREWSARIENINKVQGKAKAEGNGLEAVKTKYSRSDWVRLRRQKRIY